MFFLWIFLGLIVALVSGVITHLAHDWGCFASLTMIAIFGIIGGLLIALEFLSAGAALIIGAILGAVIGYGIGRW